LDAADTNAHSAHAFSAAAQETSGH